MGTGDINEEYNREKQSREKLFLYWLCACPDWGAVTIRRIGEYAGGYEKAYYIEGIDFHKMGIFRGEKQAQRYDGWKKQFRMLEEKYYGLGERGIRFVTPLDEEYPGRLLHMYDYPMGLYVKGKLPEEHKPTAAIIGARGCTSYGAQAAEYMGRKLAAAGVQIISGLALGIDAAGHKGALTGGGDTFGVLGCGVNICYPRTNYSLYSQIVGQGGILSEYPEDTNPLARNFPMRNRIISGLSDAVLVMEARSKSGSLITAQAGLEQGKDIFAMPGRITDALSQGCNSLLSAGAAVLTGPQDVLETLGIFNKSKSPSCEKSEKGLAKTEKMLYSCLDSSPRHLDELAGKSGLTVSQSMEALLSLEMSGFAVRTSGLYYVKGIL